MGHSEPELVQIGRYGDVISWAFLLQGNGSATVKFVIYYPSSSPGQTTGIQKRCPVLSNKQVTKTALTGYLLGSGWLAKCSKKSVKNLQLWQNQENWSESEERWEDWFSRMFLKAEHCTVYQKDLR